MYNEQPSNIMKSKQKENINNVSLNSYCNVPFGIAQYKTLNNSMMNSGSSLTHLDGQKLSKSRNKSRGSKARIKTTSTNSHFNPEKLLEAAINNKK